MVLLLVFLLLLNAMQNSQIDYFTSIFFFFFDQISSNLKLKNTLYLLLYYITETNSFFNY